MSRVNARDVATLAASGFLKGKPYSQYDCQGYIKALFREFGLKKHWYGTNDIWRNYCHDITPIKNVNSIPRGAFLLTFKPNEQPPDRYPKNSGNCSHIGIWCGNGVYWHSTTGGVQSGTSMKRWTHYALSNDLSYSDYWKGVVNMDANRIKITVKEADGSIVEKVTELDDIYDVVSVEVYNEDEG